ncbi:LAMI_0C01816g1_1 [Lachancea mirantina]|uniref:Inheritance of peroxisomes protein 1 n=1 Tax=Lachancea mirantina TaxID=1230905 RepID=A0A1G4J0G2_9SACH|nr:LAMI_0C01816g1_1 [Lachancea mirantina]
MEAKVMAQNYNDVLNSKFDDRRQTSGARTVRRTKASSPFKSLKKSILWSSKSKRDDETLDTSKRRAGKMVGDDPGNRRSAQRVTLFRYDHVKVMNCSAYLHRTNSGSSASTLHSYSSVVRNGDEECMSVSSRRTTCLVSDGPLELYQIISQGGKTPQKMTYLSLGRKGTIIHPIMPRLRVTELESDQFKIMIMLYNPERFWEIEFLPHHSEQKISPPVKTNFEDVVRSICQYVPKGPELSSDCESGSLKQITQCLDDENASDKDSDDLEYLLDEEHEPLAEQLGLRNSSDADCHDQINAAFRKAIQNIGFLGDRRDIALYEKRHGSLPGLSPHSHSDLSNRRSYSVPTRAGELFGDEKWKRFSSWMDIELEDLSENN